MIADALTAGGMPYLCAEAPRSIASPRPPRQPHLGVKLFVLDSHTIYRRGLVASLDRLDEVEIVCEADSVREAWEHPGLFACDIVLVDPSLNGGGGLVRARRPGDRARGGRGPPPCGPGGPRAGG